MSSCCFYSFAGLVPLYQFGSPLVFQGPLGAALSPFFWKSLPLLSHPCTSPWPPQCPSPPDLLPLIQPMSFPYCCAVVENIQWNSCTFPLAFPISFSFTHKFSSLEYPTHFTRYSRVPCCYIKSNTLISYSLPCSVIAGGRAVRPCCSEEVECLAGQSRTMLNMGWICLHVAVYMHVIPPLLLLEMDFTSCNPASSSANLS